MKLVKIALVFLAFLAVTSAPARAQESAADRSRVAYASSEKRAFHDIRPMGVGLVIIGAAVGIGWLTRSAVESMARQPEVAGNVQTAMIISAALIEGVTFFALIILMLFASPY